ncbi:MAG: GNAT family N-acetyltransferase [Oscillospiraceae bacterium]
MLVKTRKSTAPMLAEYIEQDPLLKLFMARDVVTFSYDVPEITFYMAANGQLKKPSDILGAALCLGDIHLYYAQKDGVDMGDYVALIKDKKPLLIQGPSRFMTQLNTALSDDSYTFTQGEGAVLYTKDKLNSQPILKERVEIATPKDIEGLCRLNQSMAEQAQLYSFESEEKYRLKLAQGEGRIYYIKKDGIIVSMGETAFEKEGCAYICDVCTHPDYRNRGYTTQIVQRLCQDLLKEGMSVGISYENPQAGRIYEKLGFTLAGEYSVMEKKEY